MTEKITNTKIQYFEEYLLILLKFRSQNSNLHQMIKFVLGVAMMDFIEEREQQLSEVGDEISILQKKYKTFKANLQPLF